MNSTMKTLNDVSTAMITFDVPDNTFVAPSQPMRIKVTYTGDSTNPVTATSMFTTAAEVNLLVLPYDNYFRDIANNKMSAYVNLTIDSDVSASKNPSLTIKFGTVTKTLTLAGKKTEEFSEFGFSPVVTGNFIKDLAPAAQNIAPDTTTHGYVKVKVNALDYRGNAIPHFQVPLDVATNLVPVRMFPTDNVTLEGEIIPSPSGRVFYINTDENGTRELYVFVGAQVPGSGISSTLDLSVNIRGLSLQYASNQVLIIAGKINSPKIAAPHIDDMDGDKLDPGPAENPDFTIEIPEYKGHADADVIFILARDANGKDIYFGHKRMHGYTFETPFLDVPYNVFPALGDYFVYYYATDDTGNASQSEDLYVSLVGQSHNCPPGGTKKFKHVVKVFTVFGSEIFSPPGNVNETATDGGLNIRVPVALNDPNYVHKGQSVVVKMRTDGWKPDGSPKAYTIDYPAPAAVSDNDIAQGYISVHVDPADLSGYDSDSHGRAGSITFEYSVNTDRSEAWYGRIDTTAPGESK